MLFSTSVV